MKKIILILFLFLLCYSCYYIYNITEKKTLNVMSIGDNISVDKYLNNNKIIESYNIDFVNKDNHITDILNTIKYNKEITKGNKSISIHQVLKKSDIVIISIGMNDIYYKLNNDTKEIYTYLNNILLIYEEILKLISKYEYKEVFILGYYNIYNKQNDIFTYTNYKLKKITNKYNYTFINLNNIFYNNQKYLQKIDNYYLNNKGIKQINDFIVEKLEKY